MDSQGDNDEDEGDTFYECYTTENDIEEEGERVDLEQMKADNRDSRLPSMKESIILDSYIINEGAVQDKSTKCRKCTAANCKECLKAEKVNHKEETVLMEMKESIKKVKLADGLYQFHVLYVTYEHIFTSSSSNYNYTCCKGW